MWEQNTNTIIRLNTDENFMRTGSPYNIFKGTTLFEGTFKSQKNESIPKCSLLLHNPQQTTCRLSSSQMQLEIRATIRFAWETDLYSVHPIGVRNDRFELPLEVVTQLEQQTPMVTKSSPKDPSTILLRASLCENEQCTGWQIRSFQFYIL